MQESTLSPFDITVALLGQFTAHGGGVHHNIVQFVLAGTTWAILLWLALYRRKKKHMVPHEDMLVWGFAFGVIRESFMLTMALLQSYGLISNEILHIFFPPLEHALLDYAMVIVCGAYLRYLLEEDNISKIYLMAGISAVTICYLATFWWWGEHIIANPASKFGQTWCDWIFRINSSVFIAIAIGILSVSIRGWTRNVICLALLFFFLHEFLKIPDMAMGEVYEHQITPFRHGFYLLGIPTIGYVYIREQIELEELTENALQHSEVLYRTLVENINLGITLIDKTHTIIMANAEQHRMFNKAQGYFSGRKCFKEFEKRDNTCEHCPGTIALQTGEPQEIDTEGIRDDGSKFKVRIRAFPVMDKHGNVESFIEVVEDITERAKIEEELNQARNLESVGVLAGGIAHDFNNILASIFGFTDLARLKLKKQNDITRELEQIRKASIRARDLIQQILTISRRQQEEKRALRISTIIKEDLKLLRSTIPTTIDIQQNIITELPILADPIQIHQLFMNLCTNAYQAMLETGGTMSVTLDDQHIHSLNSLIGDNVLPPGNYVRLQVTDTGTGMAKEIKDRIFEPYFTTKEVGKGTGLGMAVVMGIVKSHNGRIDVSSEPGAGTIITTYFPVAEREPVKELIAKEEEFQAHGDERVMAVDDESAIRMMLKEYLINLGYSVDVYKQGQEAWNAFAQEPEKWDLLITDQTMPGMTGVELIQKCREIRPGFPAILCTGYSEIINQKKAQQLGIHSYLNKPIEMDELLKIVRTTLDMEENSSPGD